MDYTEIKCWLKDNLNEEKYYHSLETADNARKIAQIIGYKDEEKAYYAGLLHDCAKCIEKDKMFDLANEFLSSDTKEPALFYVWGHSFEFDIHNTWDRFEEFCRLISGHNDVFYGTNREVFDI